MLKCVCVLPPKDIPESIEFLGSDEAGKLHEEVPGNEAPADILVPFNRLSNLDIILYCMKKYNI